MVCPKCGTEIPEGGTFCPECGTEAENVVNTQPAQAPEAAETHETPQSAGAAEAPETAGADKAPEAPAPAAEASEEPKPKKKLSPGKRVFLTLLLAAFIINGIGVVSLMLELSKPWYGSRFDIKYEIGVLKIVKVSYYPFKMNISRVGCIILSRHKALIKFERYGKYRLYNITRPYDFALDIESCSFPYEYYSFYDFH